MEAGCCCSSVAATQYVLRLDYKKVVRTGILCFLIYKKIRLRSEGGVVVFRQVQKCEQRSWILTI
eukprot:snap_masked-scaffold_3-processed-gene-7.24-mRNA-1 protein AED:1.00 eAED:1.00 QI:0/0/0/0/1/1/2/0/64